MTLLVQGLPDARALDAAKRVLKGSARVAEPFSSAEIFPAEAYTGEDFWRFERWAVFDREWLCIGHVNQAPNPGDHFTITMVGEPLIVTRDEVGELRVLSAICQHRGHPLFDGLAAPAAVGECRNSRLLVCPYHAWTYRLDGSLRGAPGMAETAPLAELRRQIRLPQIRHTVFHGLIFINFDPDAPPLAPCLAKMEAMIEGYGLADLVPTAPFPFEMRSNWKLYQENALEPYHTDSVHRDSHSAAPSRLSAFYDYLPGDGAVMTTTGFANGEELFASEGPLRLPQISGLSAEQKGRILFVAVLPVLFLVFEPGSVVVNLALPADAGSMVRRTFSLYPREATEMAGFREVIDSQRSALGTIVGEDVATQEALQRGHASRYTPSGRLSWLETTIPQMNSWLVERYRTALHVAEAFPASTRERP